MELIFWVGIIIGGIVGIFIRNKNRFTKVKIICPEHGEFEQTPETHLNTGGCPNCSIFKKKTTSDFIKKASDVHKGKYNYTNSVYTRIFDRIKIICPEHGEFEQIAKNHLDGQGCKKCSLQKRKDPVK